MSQEVGPIMIEADDSAVQETEADCKQKLDAIESARQETEFNVRHAIVSTGRILTGVVGIATSMFHALGGTFDPVQEALLGCITATIGMLHAISTALTAGVVTALFAIGTASAATILSAKAFWDVTHGIEMSKMQMRKVEDMLRTGSSMYMLFKGLGK